MRIGICKVQNFSVLFFCPPKAVEQLLKQSEDTQFVQLYAHCRSEFEPHCDTSYISFGQASPHGRQIWEEPLPEEDLQSPLNSDLTGKFRARRLPEGKKENSSPSKWNSAREIIAGGDFVKLDAARWRSAFLDGITPANDTSIGALNPTGNREIGRAIDVKLTGKRAGQTVRTGYGDFVLKIQTFPPTDDSRVNPFENATDQKTLRFWEKSPQLNSEPAEIDWICPSKGLAQAAEVVVAGADFQVFGAPRTQYRAHGDEARAAPAEGPARTHLETADEAVSAGQAEERRERRRAADDGGVGAVAAGDVGAVGFQAAEGGTALAVGYGDGGHRAEAVNLPAEHAGEEEQENHQLLPVGEKGSAFPWV
ncbi:methionine--tRNA ligase [Striga asiatica]|uniref:Methionine--tRNA ligase n=1 Tax=Striga asiatica TaxID=4170 RepID=A0A5A7QYV8_STRAF|nr:methionine--tRNA ligase [Striga asiatica]